MSKADLNNSGRVGTWGGGGNKYLFYGLLSFNAVASLDYISSRVGRVRPANGGWGGEVVQGQFYIFCQGGKAGGQNKFGQKSKGSKQFFFYNL